MVGVAVLGVLRVISFTTANSADPQLRKQALVLAESMLEEVQLARFTYCDPMQDPAAETATSAADCTVRRTRGAARPPPTSIRQCDRLCAGVQYTAEYSPGCGRKSFSSWLHHTWRSRPRRRLVPPAPESGRPMPRRPTGGAAHHGGRDIWRQPVDYPGRLPHALCAQPDMSRRFLRRARGFTLVELVVVIVIIGIVSGMVAVFISVPVRSYMERPRASSWPISPIRPRAASRATCAWRCPTACASIPAAHYLELLLTKTGGRYLSVDDNTAGNVLAFDTEPLPPANPMYLPSSALRPTGAQAIVPGDFIVVNNLGGGTSRSMPMIAAQMQPGARSRRQRQRYHPGHQSLPGRDASTLSIPSPGNRFQVVTTPVTYFCAPDAKAAAPCSAFPAMRSRPDQPGKAGAAPLAMHPSAPCWPAGKRMLFTFSALANVAARPGVHPSGAGQGRQQRARSPWNSKPRSTIRHEDAISTPSSAHLPAARGFGIVTAVFLLVVLAGLGVAMVSLSRVQQTARRSISRARAPTGRARRHRMGLVPPVTRQ